MSVRRCTRKISKVSAANDAQSLLTLDGTRTLPPGLRSAKHKSIDITTPVTSGFHQLSRLNGASINGRYPWPLPLCVPLGTAGPTGCWYGTSLLALPTFHAVGPVVLLLEASGSCGLTEGKPRKHGNVLDFWRCPAGIARFCGGVVEC